EPIGDARVEDINVDLQGKSGDEELIRLVIEEAHHDHDDNRQNKKSCEDHGERCYLQIWIETRTHRRDFPLCGSPAKLAGQPAVRTTPAPQLNSEKRAS